MQKETRVECQVSPFKSPLTKGDKGVVFFPGSFYNPLCPLFVRLSAHDEV